MREWINLFESSSQRYEDGTTPYFHGTFASFDGVPNNPKKSGIYGRGIYFSKHAKFARGFGENVYEYRVTGIIADETVFNQAILDARDQGFKAHSAYIKATELLIDRGIA